MKDFNPRPLAGATPFAVLLPSFVRISIHAPSRGRPLPKWIQMMTYDFNPRPLAGATADFRFLAGSIFISIHAPSRGRRIDPVDAILDA